MEGARKSRSGVAGCGEAGLMAVKWASDRSVGGPVGCRAFPVLVGEGYDGYGVVEIGDVGAADRRVDRDRDWVVAYREFRWRLGAAGRVGAVACVAVGHGYAGVFAVCYVDLVGDALVHRRCWRCPLCWRCRLRAKRASRSRAPRQSCRASIQAGCSPAALGEPPAAGQSSSRANRKRMRQNGHGRPRSVPCSGGLYCSDQTRPFAISVPVVRNGRSGIAPFVSGRCPRAYLADELGSGGA